MQVTLSNTIGAAMVGMVAASILYGTTVVQIFMYYRRYHRDWLVHRICVGLLGVLDTIHLALTVHAVFHYAVLKFGDLRAQLLIVWSFKLQIAVNVVIVLVVQTLYAYRVWQLGRNHNKVIPIVVGTVVVAGYVIGILLAVNTYAISSFAGLHTYEWVIYSSFIFSTAIDIAIATAICFYLNRSKTVFSRTNNRIMVIMRLVLISGFATSACSLSALITYAAMPNNLIFLGIEFLLTKLYINSYIAMLNSRNIGPDAESSNGSSSYSLGRVQVNLRGNSAVGNSVVELKSSGPQESPEKGIAMTPLPSNSAYRTQVDRNFSSDNYQEQVKTPAPILKVNGAAY